MPERRVASVHATLSPLIVHTQAHAPRVNIPTACSHGSFVLQISQKLPGLVRRGKRDITNPVPANPVAATLLAIEEQVPDFLTQDSDDEILDSDPFVEPECSFFPKRKQCNHASGCAWYFRLIPCMSEAENSYFRLYLPVMFADIFKPPIILALRCRSTAECVRSNERNMCTRGKKKTKKGNKKPAT